MEMVEKGAWASGGAWLSWRLVVRRVWRAPSVSMSHCTCPPGDAASAGANVELCLSQPRLSWLGPIMKQGCRGHSVTQQDHRSFVPRVLLYFT